MVQLILWPDDQNCSCKQCTCDRADFGEKKECECVECDCEVCHNIEEKECNCSRCEVIMERNNNI